MVVTSSPTALPPQAEVQLEEDRYVAQTAYSDVLENAIEFSFCQRTFIIDEERVLQFRQPPLLRYDRQRRTVGAPAWGFEVEDSKLASVDTEIVRHFMVLHNKAEREALNEQEQAWWIALVDLIDYQRFSAERARPYYAEGAILTTGQPDGRIYVQWHDGEKEFLFGQPARALRFLHKGDVFAGFAKRDHRDRTVRLESVTILADGESHNDGLPDDWPPRDRGQGEDAV